MTDDKPAMIHNDIKMIHKGREMRYCELCDNCPELKKLKKNYNSGYQKGRRDERELMRRLLYREFERNTDYNVCPNSALNIVDLVIKELEGKKKRSRNT